MRPEDLYATPNALARHYRRFRVAERLLLTGHSHQAWPDCGFEGQQQAWADAAEYVDDKWERAFAVADRVRRGWAKLLDDADGHIALAASTHDLVVRFLSALPLRERPRIVTTDGEFHTLRRQLGRLEEEGIEVARVAHEPAAEVADRLIASLGEDTAAVLVSAVFFDNAQIVPGLGRVLAACREAGAELLVDAYHALNVVPFSLAAMELGGAFVVGGGYKYCQLGEGNCFLRFPAECDLRPVVTGWFSEFTALGRPPARKATVYGAGPDLFAGATYDPASHYRAASVFDFFDAQGLTPELLRRVSQHQLGLLARAFDEMDADPGRITRDHAVPLEALGGFLPLRSPHAGRLRGLLRERGVFTDARGDVLRLGPAPYLSDDQLATAMAIVESAIPLLP